MIDILYSKMKNLRRLKMMTIEATSLNKTMVETYQMCFISNREMNKIKCEPKSLFKIAIIHSMSTKLNT